METFPTFALPFDTSFVSFEWLILAFALFIFAIFVLYSIFLIYHALRYGESYFILLVVLIAYFGVSLFLLGGMFSSALLLT